RFVLRRVGDVAGHAVLDPDIAAPQRVHRIVQRQGDAGRVAGGTGDHAGVLHRGVGADSFADVPAVADARRRLDVAAGDGVAQPVLGEQLRVAHERRIHAEGDGFGFATVGRQAIHAADAGPAFVPAVEPCPLAQLVVHARRDAISAFA